MNDGKNQHRGSRSHHRLRLVVMHLAAVIAAVALALLLSNLVFDGTSATRDAGLAAVAAFIGGLGREPLGDAIMFTIIVGTICTLACVLSPLSLFWKQVALALSVGLCGGKLVMGVHAEFEPS